MCIVLSRKEMSAEFFDMPTEDLKKELEVSETKYLRALGELMKLVTKFRHLVDRKARLVAEVECR